MEWIVTGHARQRYAERIGGGEILDDLSSARRPTRRQKRAIRDACPAHAHLVRLEGYPWFQFVGKVRRDGAQPVFVCKCEGRGLMAVVTCWAWREAA